MKWTKKCFILIQTAYISFAFRLQLEAPPVIQSHLQNSGQMLVLVGHLQAQLIGMHLTVSGKQELSIEIAVYP